MAGGAGGVVLHPSTLRTANATSTVLATFVMSNLSFRNQATFLCQVTLKASITTIEYVDLGQIL